MSALNSSLEVAIMIEGQHGLNWPRWQRIARAVEDLGFAGLFRSDHYTNASPPYLDSLELWVSLAWLASHTSRIEFGPLVTPVSFRQPTMTARMAAAVDDLSGGRLRLGLGAGWQEREHLNYGWDLLDVKGRLDRFEEGVQVVTHLMRRDEPLNFQGRYYRLHDAVVLPRPKRRGGPPIVIGGNGERRTLPLAARYADEWNAVFINPGRCAELNRRLDGLLAKEGRPVAAVFRTLMTGTVIGGDAREVAAKVASRAGGHQTADELKQRGIVVGSGDDVVEQVNRFAEAGVQRIMLQWLDLDDLDGLERLAHTLLPAVQAPPA